MIVRVETEFRVDFFEDAIHVGGGQINFINDRNYRKIVFHCQVEIGQSLSLNTLGGIDQQQHAFAGSQRPGDFVRESPHVPAYR